MSANITFAVLQWLIAAFVAGSIFGYTFRSKQIAKSKRRVLELETEMVENHAEILRLHKIHSDKSNHSGGKVPVISLSLNESTSAIDRLKAKA